MSECRRSGRDFRSIIKRTLLLGAAGFTASLMIVSPPVRAQAAPSNWPEQKVYGRVAADSSSPTWPQPLQAPAGAPNVLLIMTDDVGFASASTFGGAIPTPALDGLAKTGARYTAFNTTAMCSPTRASLLTGRDPQAVGMGFVSNFPSGYDGYNSVIPRSAGTVAAVLKNAGYNTAMIGKGHITPEWEQGTSGPFDRWPTGLGFQYFYGFIGADSSIFEPDLVENTTHVRKPVGKDYALDADLADHAMQWIANQKASNPDRPFFMYFAPSAAHAPNQAPAEWLKRFRGKFDRGWDEMRIEAVQRQKTLGIIPKDATDASRPNTLPLWKTLSAQQRIVYSRHMEAYAAQLAFADEQIGRVINSLRQQGQFDNTMIIYIQGDNGAGEEGGFNGQLFDSSSLAGIQESMDHRLEHVDDIGGIDSFPLIPGGWGWAMNAPFPWAKRYASHFGGTRNGVVVNWPAHITDPQTLRTQFHHVRDIMPTILDVAGVSAPEQLDGVPQQPITGVSMRYTFEQPNAPSHRRLQAFGLGQNLAIYADGWVAATKPDSTYWDIKPKPIPFDERDWELYDISSDFNESKNIAARFPRKLETMKQLFWAEAGRSGILPVHPLFNDQSQRPDQRNKRSHFEYTLPVSHIPESLAPSPIGRSFDIDAQIEVGESGGNGVLVAQGGRYGGYSLFLDDGVPTFTYNVSPISIMRVKGKRKLTGGSHEIKLSFDSTSAKAGAAAVAKLTVDGMPSGSVPIPSTFGLTISFTEGFDVGSDEVSPVDTSYTVESSRFDGMIKKVKFGLR